MDEKPKTELGKIETARHLKIPISRMIAILKDARDKGIKFDNKTYVTFIFKDSEYIGYEFEDSR